MWLGVWGGLLAVGSAHPQILTISSDQHDRLVTPAELATTEEGNKRAPERLPNLEESGTPLDRETDFGPVKGIHWRDDENIYAFFDVPYGAFKKPFAVSITNVTHGSESANIQKVKGDALTGCYTHEPFRAILDSIFVRHPHS